MAARIQEPEVLCACGCGASVPQRDSKGRLTYRKWVMGHSSKGRKQSPESVQKSVEGRQRGFAPTKVCGGCKQELPREEFRYGGRLRYLCPPCHRARSAKRLRDEWGNGSVRKRTWMKKYNLTSEQYDAIVAVKCCAICGVEPENERRDLVFDHCHSTGRVRGRLCRLCNVALGAFRDDPSLLRIAADYIETGRM